MTLLTRRTTTSCLVTRAVPRCHRRSAVRQILLRRLVIYPRDVIYVLIILGLMCYGVQPASSEYVREFEVPENVAVGALIGHIGASSSKEQTVGREQTTLSQQAPPLPPYLIVPVPGSAVDSDLEIDQSTGEIRTKIILDRETKSYYSFVAIPSSGENIRVVVNVLDENDNAPEFPHVSMDIEFPENSPRDSKRTLNPARDKDMGLNNVQQYKIVSGNSNNAFRLSSHRERDDVLYLDLQVNGFLDRETTPFYKLVIEAHDGGIPPLKGSTTVNITILDVNDNQPLFNQSRYSALIAENATSGTGVLSVFATDADSRENGQVSYAINRRQSDRENFFGIDPKTGVISVNRPLDFEKKDVHELVVVARDNGAQPLETTAFVTVQVVDVNDNQPTISLIFLRDDASPRISEDAQPGEFVARISVNDPDSKTEYSNANVTLEGGDGHFGLTTRDNIIYLVFVNKPLDRELQSNYTLVVTATDQGSPPLQVSTTFDLIITDVNDNAPQFEQTMYYTSVLEVADPGTSVLQLSAVDRDEGNNSLISYSIKDTPDTHSQWFQINSKTGLITTRSHVDCETNPSPKITVIATDHGHPPMSTSATVTITILDVNDNEPIFDQSFYNVSVMENEAGGKCILKVSASDADCGVNGKVNYTLGDTTVKTAEFFMNPVSGELCIRGQLDHEKRNSYEFPVVATDRGSLSTTAMAKIQVIDVNDNRPVFYPREYNVSLKEQVAITTPVIAVVATDADSDKYGRVTYKIVTGNDQELFRIDSGTGEIFLKHPLSKGSPMHHLTVSAVDGGGLTSAANAQVWVSAIDPNQQPPIFDQSRYSFVISEDSKVGTTVGVVRALGATGSHKEDVRYSISSGDPDGYFTIDPMSGDITTNVELDHEAHSSLLLNVQALSGDPPSYGHTQVNVTIKDANDNAPIFDSPEIRISVSENVDLGSAIYAAHATDPDDQENGAVTYELLRNPKDTFQIELNTGYLMLRHHLDYETQQRYALIVGATDGGQPANRSNMTLTVEVQDVNDNPPIFEKSEYVISVAESLTINMQFLQVTASDKDTGNNARLTYIIEDDRNSSMFGIFPNSGSLYLKEKLDREHKDHYTVTVVARDNGSPSLSATCTVKVTVLDVNDNDPKFSHRSYNFFVWENMEKGIHVGTVTAVDQDLGNNSSVRYSLVPNNTNFHIDAVTGVIVARMSLDREQKDAYNIIAHVHDEGNPPRSDSASVTIRIGDLNDNSPAFVEPKADVVGIREEQPIGTEVIQVLAIDDDEGMNGTVVYSLIKEGDALDADAFEINPDTGIISTGVALDHEQKSIYRVAVLAKDNGQPALQEVRILRIEVLDLNDNRPAFSSMSIALEVQENVPLGTNVGSVNAMDSDGGENGRVSYSIMGGNRLHVFQINRTTGVLYAARPVDYEQASVHVLQVKAVDNGALNPMGSVVNVTIKVEDVNDNAPMFEKDPMSFTVPETVGLETVIWNFTAVDKDSGLNGEVRYAIKKSSSPIPCDLDEVTGVLKMKELLDFEVCEEYTFVVIASDSANASKRLQSSVTVRLLVEDVNDNAPSFVSRNRVVIPEGEPIGFPVLNVVALDMDSGDNGKVSYTILLGNDEKLFALNASSGLLTIAQPLDREITSKYILNISASDNGRLPLTSYQTVEILVEDVNDNNPTFEHPIYVANMSENSPPDTYVMTVSAIDKDIGINANLTFLLPDGVSGNKFSIDPVKGEIRTLMPLDREEQENHVITVYVRDGAFPARYDTATVIVGLTDVNDNSPVFHDSCYPLFVPENSDLAVIHTVVAEDVDSGPNGEVTYSLTGGNTANKFSIDLHTGQLTAAPLDREIVASYILTVAARDSSDSPRTTVCNISVTVEDQNDNDPRFSQEVYTLTIPEDITANTTVLVLTASDADAGDNAHITYSLSNETQWLFKIDSHTGAVTTAGMFDREKRAVYSFEVRATDGGKYDARSEKTLVQVTIGDVNDNKPIFGKYPYIVDFPGNVQAGAQIIQIAAQDKDEGPNAEIVYSFANADLADKFHINPESGIVTAVGNLKTDSDEVYHLVVVAQDKGKPAHTSIGMIQIQVGEQTEMITLKFSNATYSVQIPENLLPGRDVVQISAARSDGKRVGITYSFSSGNEEGTFDIAPATGFIQVKDSRRLDYEFSPRIRLIVTAQSDGPYPLYSYATVWINVIDQNDNPPRFTQDHYVSAVWEGNNKGTFVMQVSATDDDQGQNGNIVYHIVDGNYDNAFVIEPPFSGIVKTNIVLDREIREFYRLTIIAMDEGTPQLTGTCTLRINIIDVNDNQPTFPPQNIVSVSEAAKIGMAVTTITANDVDTNPALTYDFANGGNPDGLFSIDRYSGKITLSKPLDHEKRPQHLLRIQASDTAHVVDTTLTVNVIDENDNVPVFSQQFYQVTIMALSEPGSNIITINATDQDSGDNGRIKYTLKHSGTEGFFINERTGTIYTNKSAILDRQQETVQLIVIAEDRGLSPQSSSAAVRIQFADFGTNKPQFSQRAYTTRIGEDTAKGNVVLKVSLGVPFLKQGYRCMYSISDDKGRRYFDIDNQNGDIILVGDVDREKDKVYNLIVTAADRGMTARNTTAEVAIYVEDANDNPPLFEKSIFVVNVSESAAIDNSVFQLVTHDPDEGDNSKVAYDLTSGNDNNVFEISRQSGSLILKKRLDYEKQKVYRLVVHATNGKSKHVLSSIATIVIKVQDENDNEPFFPLPSYLEFIAENSPIGTLVFHMHAYDADAGIYGKLNYSIADQASREKFRIDTETGAITTNVVFDYELENQYLLSVVAQDLGGKRATARIRIDVESKDEHAPIFLENYHFVVPGNAAVGYILGRVEATDKDKGPDGRIVYQLRSSHPNFKINRTSGEIMVKTPFRRDMSLRRRRRELRGKDVSLVVSASSGRPNSLTNITIVEITVDFLNGTALAAGPHSGAGGLAGWTLGLVIALAILAVVLFSVIVFLRYRNRRIGKSGMAQEFDSSFDTIDIRPPPASPSGLSQYPPGYDDIAHYGTAEGTHHHRGNTTSEISDQSNSASSGRGSAEEGEDVEDEEIRMINEGPLMQQKMRNRLGMPDSGIQEDNEDNISESSVHNTQEYLARLGINTARSEANKSPQDFDKIIGGHSMESMHMFDDEGGGESDGVDITNLIYAKLNEVGTEENDAIMDGTRTYGFGDESQLSMTGSLSSIVHSEEELTGSYNWDYLLDWGPQYQPLAHVFAEIARLKDDSAQHGFGGQTVPKKTLNPQVKALPPPLITNVAPRSIAPVALSSTRTSQVASLPSLPRSPIGHESTFMSSAMSPSFSPALSPLATRSPSISPLVAPGSATLSISTHPSNGSSMLHPRIQRAPVLSSNTTPESDNELRI